MSLSYTFPFSQALSITRREFFFGTMLAALVTAVLLGAVFAVGGAIERATGGWGVNGYFFSLDWVWTAGPGAPGSSSPLWRWCSSWPGSGARRSTAASALSG